MGKEYIYLKCRRIVNSYLGGIHPSGNICNNCPSEAVLKLESFKKFEFDAQYNNCWNLYTTEGKIYKDISEIKYLTKEEMVNEISSLISEEKEVFD